MKVYVSGLNGFIGKHLSEKVDNKVELFYLNRNKINDSLFKLDHDVNAVIHLAGKAHDLNKKVEYSDYEESNFKLTKNLYSKFLNSNCKKFVFVSSVKASCDESDFLLNEKHKPNPKSFYGISKLKAENFILENHSNDKKTFVLRPALVYGENLKGNLNLLHKYCKYNFPWPFSSYINERSYCSIDNLCFVINELLNERDIKSGIYNVCDDMPISTNELVKIISRSLEKKIVMFSIPKPLIEFLIKFADLINFKINSKSFKKITGNFKVSNKKIKKALKIDSMPIEINNGIYSTFKINNNE